MTINQLEQICGWSWYREGSGRTDDRTPNISYYRHALQPTTH